MTERLPEPLYVGPSAGGNLRASDADREQVSTLLSAAYAEGRLTRDEHDERLDQVMAARTFDDLVPITADLVPVGRSAVPTPAPAAADGFAIERPTNGEQDEKMVAIFGGVNRKGKWRIKKRTQAMALFGGMDLDFSEAIFEDQEVEISGFWVFGGMDIRVPAGMEVHDHVSGIFGGTDIADLGERRPGAPVLTIKGLALFGGVSVKGPKPPKKKR